MEGLLLAYLEPEAEHLRGLLLSSESRNWAAFLLTQSAKCQTPLAVGIAIAAENVHARGLDAELQPRLTVPIALHT